MKWVLLILLLVFSSDFSKDNDSVSIRQIASETMGPHLGSSLPAELTTEQQGELTDEDNFIKDSNAAFAKVADYLSIPNVKGQCKFSRKELFKLTFDAQYNYFAMNAALPSRADSNLVFYEREIGKNKGHWDCYYFKRNLKRSGSQSCLPDPQKVFARESYSSPIHVEGKLKYLGLFKNQYKYDVSADESGIKVSTNINFKEDESTRNYLNNVDYFKKQLNDGLSSIWNMENKYLPISMNINLDTQDPYFEPYLRTKENRGPYFKQWQLDYKYTAWAHEFGHMLGLDDEYNNFNESMVPINTIFGNAVKKDRMKAVIERYLKTYECEISSLMCNDKNGKPHGWYYYAILSRALCQ